MSNVIFEATLVGYDGSTDETDDKIIWVLAGNPEEVTRFLTVRGMSVDYVNKTDLPLDSAGVDYRL